MPELWELTKLIRSKNAGPFELTFDIMFKTQEEFEAVRAGNFLSPEVFSRIYKVPIGQVRHFVLDELWAIKVSIPRAPFSGDKDDPDVYGGQFHSPLVRLVVG
ncbi:MAG: DUF4387 family protein [Terriglobales bacterium]